MNHRIKVKGAVWLLACSILVSLCVGAEERGLPNEFFAMDTGTIDVNHKTAEAQVEMLKELGYAGLAYWEGNPKRGNYGLADVLCELDKNGLKIYPLYYGVWLDEDKPKYDESMEEAIKLLKGRDGTIWLHIMSEKYKKSSPEGDERAVEIVREIADMAQEAGLRVALYPHVNDWLERVGDAVRVAQKVNRRNVGVTFNLFHWLRVEGQENMEEVMRLAMPYLFVVTINGSSLEGSIETLDKGEFDVYKFLKKLNELGYTGLIGLQGYGLKGDVRENLSRSMEAWRGFSARMAAEKD